MRTYWNTNRGLRTLEKWEPNCWVQVTCPTQDDIDYLENTLHIPDYFLMDIADTDERPAMSSMTVGYSSSCVSPT